MFVASLRRVVARRALPSGLNSLAARRLVLARAFSGSSLLRDPTTATATIKKQPATKKVSITTKTTTTKTKTKAKPAAKKKKAPAKAKKAAAAPKKKKKKKAVIVKKKKKRPQPPLTEEQKEKIKLRYLKMVSLWRGPTTRPPWPWTVYVAENMQKGTSESNKDKLNKLYARYAKLSPAEKQTLEARAAANREWNERERVRWVKSYPVEVVYLANLARRRLVRITKRNRTYIHDDRQPKRPAGAFPLFVRDRHSSIKTSSSTETLVELQHQWKSMSDAEKKPWKDEADAQRVRCKGQFDNFTAKARKYWLDNKPKRVPTVPKIRTSAAKPSA
ncbi:hypothetical protein CP533_4066 [Ophiocordyceps camponoti-saundersi (nom. inval.)]|nr:hypothetical protein CP533_4066 [Ophiocordyceps camponoti-saundersi (nom. inval.)]